MRERKLQAEEISHVVVRGTNWVGDAVMTIPALRELRRVLPQARITLATRSWAEGLFRDADFLDEIQVYDRGRHDSLAVLRQAKQWRRRRFDLAVLFQNAFEAALLARLARVPVRLGYATDGRRPLLTHPVALPSWHKRRHELFYYLNLIAALEQNLYGSSDILEREPHFALRVSEARKARALEMLKAHGARPARPLVALCPGSTNSRAKRWPAASYAVLADRLIEELKAEVILVGAPDEVEVSEAVKAQMRREPVMLTGRTSLNEAVELLSLADLLITNDTGPAHIASALERPTLVIFGPTDPATTRPFSKSAKIVRHPPDCAPCMLRDCPIDHRCMTAISPDEIFAEACEMLRQARLEVGA